MIFITPEKTLSAPSEQYMWTAYLIIAAVFLFGFFFRDAITKMKERVKASIRKFIFDKFVDSSVEGSTLKTQDDGFFMILLKFLD